LTKLPNSLTLFHYYNNPVFDHIEKHIDDNRRNHYEYQSHKKKGHVK